MLNQGQYARISGISSQNEATAEAGRMVQKMIDGIYLAAEKGKEVAIQELARGAKAA